MVPSKDVTPEEIWRRKSDEEIETAATQLADYTEVGELIIRAELRRRGFPEPEAVRRVDVVAIETGVPQSVRITGDILNGLGGIYIMLVVGAVLYGGTAVIGTAIPHFVTAALIAGTGTQFRLGQKSGVIWLAGQLTVTPVIWLIRSPQPVTDMATAFFIAAVVGLPAIVVAVLNWKRLAWS